MVEATFTPRAPFLLRASVGAPDSTRRYRGGLLELVYATAAGPARARVWQASGGRLHARIEAGDAAAAHDRLAELLTIGLDHRPFLELVAGDPLLHGLRPRMAGVRPLLLGSPGHALVRAVSGQLIRWREARAIERRILAEVCRRHGGLLLPPSPAALAAVHPARFERAGLSPARAVLLGRAAALPWAAMATEPTGRVERRLLRLRGLGPWSAGAILMYGLGRPERGLAGDLGLVRLASALLERPATAADTEQLLAHYGRWQALASLWLLHHPLAGRGRVAAGRSAVTSAP